MDSEWIIGALAFMTIGGVLALSIFHFVFRLKDPKNLEAVKSIAADRESEATKVSAEGVDGRTLRQRLNDAPGLNDRLSDRAVGVNPWDALFGTKWSSLRSTLKGEP